MTDLRYAVRMLGRQPGFAAAVILALALGIGVNTTIFRFVDGLLFRPLPVEDLDRVMRVEAVDPQRDPNDYFNSSYPVFTDYRDGATSFSALAAYADQLPLDLAFGGNAPERLTGALVTGRYFDVLRTHAWRGRLIDAKDDRAPGGHPVAVISYGLWQRAFGGDDAAVGRTVSVNRRPFTIIGITPPGVVGVSLDSLPDLWMPMAMASEAMPGMARDFPPLQTRHFYWLDIVGRLKPGATVAQAQAEMDLIASRRAAPESKDDREPFAKVVPAGALVAQTEETSRYERMSWILLAVVGLILAIACADAAGLLLVRAERRRREIAVRLAIGATRARIFRQLLVESLLLAALAAAVGLLLAAWSSAGLMALLPADFPLAPAANGPVADPRVLLFTVVVSLAAGLAFGIAPAWRASRPDLVLALKQDVPTVGRRRRIAIGQLLVVGQVAVSVLLVVGASLLIRTVMAFAHVSPGFSHRSALVASVDVSLQGYDDARGRQYFNALERGVAALPGVTDVSLARMVPVQSSGMRVTFDIAGQPSRAPDSPLADYNPVTPGFLSTLGIPLLEGRGFSDRDSVDGVPVVIVNHALAAKYFPGRSAVGQHLARFGPGSNNPEIVGVAGDARYRTLRDVAAPMIYVPHAQGWMPRMSLVVQTSVPPATLVPALTDAAAKVDAGVPLFQVQTLEERMRASLAVERLLAWLLASFSALAVFLAAAGLYGVVSVATAARTREFGIRMALGATARRLAGMVLASSLAVIGAGFAVGAVLSVVLARGLGSLLFGVGPTDAGTYVTAGVVFVVLGSVAALWPARRAARIDPAAALRSEERRRCCLTSQPASPAVCRDTPG
jgi:putative ABC transport system permease protein